MTYVFEYKKQNAPAEEGGKQVQIEADSVFKAWTDAPGAVFSDCPEPIRSLKLFATIIDGIVFKIQSRQSGRLKKVRPVT